MAYPVDFIGKHIEYEHPKDESIGGGGRCLDTYFKEDMRYFVVRCFNGIKQVPIEWMKNYW